MQRANALGRALRYVTEAASYASEPFRGVSKGPRKADTNPILASILRSAARFGMGGGEDADLEYYMRLAVNNPEVWSDVSLIADRVGDSAGFTVQHMVHNEWEDIERHPFGNLLRRPNSLMPGGLLLRELVWWLCFTGNSYWFLVTDEIGEGPITEIWPLPSRNVRPRPDSLRISLLTGEPIIDYEYNYGEMIMLPGENVLHVRNQNLFDFWRGMSPLTALQDTLKTDSNQRNWIGSFFGEGNAIPTAVITVPRDVSDEELETIRQDVITDFGAKRKTAIARAGDFEIETIQHSIDEMKVYDGLKYYGTQFRRVFNVPEGLSESASGQARLAAEIALARDAIQPMLNFVAEWFTMTVLPYYEDGSEELRIVADNIIPQDRAMDVTEFQAYSDHRTMNENRQQLDLDEIKLKGELTVFQPFIAEVPEKYVELFAQLMMASAQAGGIAPTEALGPGQQNGTNPQRAQLVDQLAGVEANGADPQREQVLNALTGGQANSREDLVEQLAGVSQNGRRQLTDQLTSTASGTNSLIDRLVGNQANIANRMAGNGNDELVEMGSRVGMTPTQEQLLKRLTGQKSFDLSPEEQEAMLQAAINTKIAHGDPVEDIFTQALYVVRSQKT